jgi:hypothetical protein
MGAAFYLIVFGLIAAAGAAYHYGELLILVHRVFG